MKLNENVGTASGRLRKMILFDLVKRLDLDICYRCNEQIKSASELSIDHKIPWRFSDNSHELFFDLDNIAFSHHKCNTEARRPKRKNDQCGTYLSYTKKKCRCKLCVEAKRVVAEKYRKSRK